MTIRGALSRIAAIVALGGAASLVITGCAEGKQPTKKTPLPTADDDDKKSGDDDDDSKSPSSSANNEKSGELDPENGEKPPSAEEPATPPAADPPVTPPADPPANPIAKTATCMATKDGFKSVAAMNYTLTGKVIKVTRLTIEITNKDNRNKNDIDFFLTPQGGTEKKLFNSGDILTNGVTTAVAVPDNADINAGTKVRIETNFDTSFTDPSASCTMQL
jgi:hypothetical protein